MFQVMEGFASSQTDVIENKISIQLQQSWSSLRDICLNKQMINFLQAYFHFSHYKIHEHLFIICSSVSQQDW